MIWTKQRLWLLSILLIFLLFAVSIVSADDFDRPLLFLNLPEDAQMIENVQFDDGDFIQTYQLNGNAHITLLRYAEFNMSANELTDSEWDGATDITALNLDPIDGFKTEGIRCTYTEAESDPLIVTLVIITAGKDTLVFEAVYPVKIGEDQIKAAVDGMIQSMHVVTMSESNLG